MMNYSKQNKNKSKSSCLGTDEGSEVAITLEQAKKKCFSAIQQTLTTKKISIRLAFKRLISQDIIAPINVPSHTNSAMDGFALRKEDINSTASFTIVNTAYAGRYKSIKINPNECVRIMTGASIPENADIVIPQEFTCEKNGKITIDGYSGGENIRLAGEDLNKGSIVLKKGRKLNAADLGLLASLGIAEVNVWRKLRVAFFSTGDELRDLTQTLNKGEIYDSNRYSLFGMLEDLNVDITDMGVIKDDYHALKKAFIKASKSADVIITTGGVSVGQADYVEQVLSDVGKVNFWKLAIKPGRPLTFGKVNDAYFFGLPGNPVAVMITFYQVAQPFLKRLMGQTQNIAPFLINAISLDEIFKSQGRTEFIRARFSNDNGQLTVKKLKKQGSGVLSSMSNANCLIVLSENNTSVKKGDIVQIQPFFSLT